MVIDYPETYIEEVPVNKVFIDNSYLDSTNLQPQNQTKLYIDSNKENDVFRKINDKLYNKKIIDFFDCLKRNIINKELNDMDLGEIIESSEEEDELFFEWNFSKFRSYFYFDLSNFDNSEFGFINQINDTLSGKRSKFSDFDFETVAEMTCKFVKNGLAL